MKKNKMMFLSAVIFLIFGSTAWAISWESDLNRAFEKAKSANRPVMADFYTDWCGWCKKLDKDVYEDVDVNRLAEKFICVKVNCTADKKTPSRYGINGYPTIIFFDAGENAIETVTGYRPAPIFVDLMSKVLERMPPPIASPKTSADNPPAKVVAMRGEADTVYLKNGRRISGIIVKEGARIVEIEIGGGSIAINRSEIKTIRRAKPAALAEFKDSLEERQNTLMAQEKTFADERAKRLKAYGDWAQEEARRKASEHGKEGEVKIMRNPQSRAILVETVLNGDTKAVLTIDTGADLVVLSKYMGDRMGIDTSADSGNNIREMHLAGGKTIKARMFVLKTVAIQEIEEKDVLAAVLLEDASYGSFKDGLLGRSFLDRFNINIDVEKMSMVLKKLK